MGMGETNEAGRHPQWARQAWQLVSGVKWRAENGGWNNEK